jgi:ribonuclease HI
MIIIFSDGGSYNNQHGDKRDAYGSFMVETEKKQHRFKYGNKTNNEAEYLTLIKALYYIKNKRTEKEFVLFTDSQLITKQLDDTWRCKNEKLQPLYQEAKDLVNSINDGKHVVIAWVDNKKMKKVLGH